MKIQFYRPEGAHEDLLAEAFLIFEESGLRGLSLAGVTIWRRPGARHAVSVSLPSRTYTHAGNARRYWLLRGDRRLLAKLRDDIAAEFARRHPHVAARLAASASI